MLEFIVLATLLGAIVSDGSDPDSDRLIRVLQRDSSDLLNAVARRQVELEEVASTIELVTQKMAEAGARGDSKGVAFFAARLNEFELTHEVWRHEVAFHELQVERILAQIKAIRAGERPPQVLTPESKAILMEAAPLNTRVEWLVEEASSRLSRGGPVVPLLVELTDLNLRQLDLMKRILDLEGVEPLISMLPGPVQFA